MKRSSLIHFSLISFILSILTYSRLLILEQTIRWLKYLNNIYGHFCVALMRSVYLIIILCLCAHKYTYLPSWVWESQLAFTGNSVSWSLGHSSRSSFHRTVFFPSLKQNFIAYHSSKVLIAFLKFTSCDNQALVGCIPIPAVAVDLNLKSWKLVSHLIRYIAITYWNFKSLRQLYIYIYIYIYNT